MPISFDIYMYKEGNEYKRNLWGYMSKIMFQIIKLTNSNIVVSKEVRYTPPSTQFSVFQITIQGNPWSSRVKSNTVIHYVINM